MAAVAAPVMGPVSDLVLDTIGDSILVEVGLHAGFEVTAKVTNDLVIEHAIKHVIPSPSARLETTGIKTLLITLKYKHTIEDAALGFYRSSLHADSSLFANVKDYLATEKGVFAVSFCQWSKTGYSSFYEAGRYILPWTFPQWCALFTFLPLNL